MKRVILLLGVVGAATLAAVTWGPSPDGGTAASHREAPAISEDPAADNTDLYAFRSLEKPNSLTIVSNWQPAEDPGAGPLWYEFSPNARYNIYIDKQGDGGRPSITYRFKFQKSEPVAFLRTTVQRYTVTRIANGKSKVVARGTTPPNNVGPRFLGANFGTTNYRSIAAKGVTPLNGGGLVFAGQRDDAFFADIGAIFDLLGFRGGVGGEGKDFFAGYAVHAVALQIPIASLNDRDGIVGVWSSTDRRVLKVRGNNNGDDDRRLARNDNGRKRWVQVSRMGNPLVNELIIPTQFKDRWNALPPGPGDRPFLRYFRRPILAALINQLYPGVINAPERNRDDLVAVLLTGVKGLNKQVSPSKAADLVRINLNIPPTPANKVNRLGVIGGDLAGYPNGRRLEDDTIDISEQAVGGILLGNTKASVLSDGVNSDSVASLDVFPYEADPFSGFVNSKGNCENSREEVAGQIANCPLGARMMAALTGSRS
jgi:Domain of unknown function (DUF4331)